LWYSINLKSQKFNIWIIFNHNKNCSDKKPLCYIRSVWSNLFTALFLNKSSQTSSSLTTFFAVLYIIIPVVGVLHEQLLRVWLVRRFVVPVFEHVVVVHVSLVRGVTTGRGLAGSSTATSTTVSQQPMTDLPEDVLVFAIETFLLDHGFLDFQLWQYTRQRFD